MTPEEERAISAIVAESLAVALAEIGRAEWLQDGALLDYLQGNLTREAIAAQPELYNALVKSITLPINEAALQEARTMASRQAATLVTGDARTQLRAIGEVISDGLKRGDSPQKIGRRLKMVDGLDAQRARKLDKYIESLEKLKTKQSEIERKAERMKAQLLRDRRETIARTETRNAQEAAAATEARAAGKKYKCWVTVGDDRVSEPCPTNEGKGWIDIDAVFPSGHAHPPAHPNCRCTLAYRKAEPDEAAKERVQRRIDRTATAAGK